MNVIDYPTLHLGAQIQVREQHFYSCTSFYCHSRVFNNEKNLYPNHKSVCEMAHSLKMSSNLTSVNKRHI